MSKKYLFVFVILFIVGCGAIKSKRLDLGESKKDVTKSASKTDLTKIESKPLVDATGAKNTQIDVKVEGPIPEEKVTAYQEKTASEDTFLDLSIREVYKSYSSWFYIGLAIAGWLLWLLWKRVSSGWEAQSVKGGLRALKRIGSMAVDKLTQFSPESDEWKTMNRFYQEVKEKEESLLRLSESERR